LKVLLNSALGSIFNAELAHFPIDGGAANAKLSYNLGHLATIVTRRQPDHVNLDVQQTAHITTKPYTPKTNGKAERFIRTSLEEWAHKRPFIAKLSVIYG
jgi:transposase InsO family protein